VLFWVLKALYMEGGISSTIRWEKKPYRDHILPKGEVSVWRLHHMDFWPGNT